MCQDYGINNKKSKRLVFCFIHLNKYVRILLYQGGIMKEYTKKVILLSVILFCTLLILFIALRINENRLYEKSLNSKIKRYLTEIKYEEISTHLVERPNAIIYVSNSSNSDVKKFEKKLIPVIKKYNLENEIIYININEVNIVDPIYQNAPELLFYKNNMLEDIIDCNTLKTKKDIIKILKERSVIDD